MSQQLEEPFKIQTRCPVGLPVKQANRGFPEKNKNKHTHTHTHTHFPRDKPKQVQTCFLPLNGLPPPQKKRCRTEEARTKHKYCIIEGPPFLTTDRKPTPPSPRTWSKWRGSGPADAKSPWSLTIKFKAHHCASMCVLATWKRMRIYVQ